MVDLFDPRHAYITIGGGHHLLYIALITGFIILTISSRHLIRKYRERVMAGILLIAILQRVFSLMYYIIAGEYSLEESLPLHLCRVVCLLIILQFFIDRKWLDQVIFYWGIFAYASFIYPVEISPLSNMLGITFLMLHSLNILFPLVRYYTTGFIPSLKGAFYATGLFIIYLFAMALLNHRIGSNYFYLEDRPFLHDMGELPYFLINLGGVSAGFIIIGSVFSYITRKYRNDRL